MQKPGALGHRRKTELSNYVVGSGFRKMIIKRNEEIFELRNTLERVTKENVKLKDIIKILEYKLIEDKNKKINK